jgi:hypothetical protein
VSGTLSPQAVLSLAALAGLHLQGLEQLQRERTLDQAHMARDARLILQRTRCPYSLCINENKIKLIGSSEKIVHTHTHTQTHMHMHKHPNSF